MQEVWKNIDSESIIFWEEGLPFLDFRETDNITFKGENILGIRPDIDKIVLWRYISSFYRHFPAKTFVKIIKESPKDQIKRLILKSKSMPIVLENNVLSSSKELDAVPFNYEKSKEIGAFHKQNCLKTLAYLVLSEKIASHRIPYDLIQAEIFFNENFKGSKKDVFEKCCAYHELNSVEVLKNYSQNINYINYYAINKDNNKKKLSTLDVFISVFNKITK